MDPVLQQEVVAAAATVTLGNAEYPLAFPMRAVILYKQLTASLNRERGARRPKLSAEESTVARARFRSLLGQLDGTNTPDEMSEILQGATFAKLPLDEDCGEGDSLALVHNWYRITLDDPERVIFALWSGLHVEQQDGTWKAPFTLQELQSDRLVNLGNLGGVLLPISKTLTAYLKRTSGSSPNAAAPEAAVMRPPAPTTMAVTTISSECSGPLPVSTSG